MSDELIHGRRSTYTDHRCHCAPCTAANTEYHARQRTERYAKTARNGGVAPVEQHGTLSTYANWGCNCGPCTAANAAHSRRTKVRARARAAS